MRTSELTGAALDWAVAKCLYGDDIPAGFAAYSAYWSQAGTIIERERISTCWEGTTWVATLFNKNGGETWHGHHYGPTPLIAAMRCYVASKLGDNVDIPKGLMQ